MDFSEAFSLHFVNFSNKYRVLQRKKLYFIQKYLESQMQINLNYLQILESYRRATECLNSFKYECMNQSNDILLRRIVRRKIWKLERKSSFWEDEVPKFSNEKFKQVFRLTRSSFKKLCEKLYFLKKADTNKRKAITLEKRIAIALYALGSSSEYKPVANLFGVGRTTVGHIVLDFCTAVSNTLEEIYISSYPPSQDKIREVVSGFQRLGFPQCYGAIDGCHIKIVPHKEKSTDYLNSKGWYSVILFASADYRCRFTYINVGAKGRNNDSSIFENSILKEDHETNVIFQDNATVIETTRVPILLIGDLDFRLSKFVMTPYPCHPNQSAEEKKYNKILLKCRSVIENTFDQLKARFRKIGKGLEVRPENSSTIIKACCVLHNFLNGENDNVWNRWLEELKETKSIQPSNADGALDENATEDGKTIREALTIFFSRREAEQPEMDSGAGDGDNAIGSGVESGGGDVETFIGGDIGTA